MTFVVYSPFEHIARTDNSNLSGSCSTPVNGKFVKLSLTLSSFTTERASDGHKGIGRGEGGNYDFPTIGHIYTERLQTFYRVDCTGRTFRLPVSRRKDLTLVGVPLSTLSRKRPVLPYGLYDGPVVPFPRSFVVCGGEPTVVSLSVGS